MHCHFKETYFHTKNDRSVSVGTFDGIIHIVYYYIQGVHINKTEHSSEQEAKERATVFLHS